MLPAGTVLGSATNCAVAAGASTVIVIDCVAVPTVPVQSIE
jgi:hypothetical protein